MHRAYQTIIPTSNKYLQQKWDKSDYQRHRIKVQKATTVVDTRGPQTPAHLQVKLKKLQLEKERLAIIRRDNQILSSKLADIMSSNGTVDNWNNYANKSLNAEKRQRELKRIAQENQAILHRITHRQSEYRRSRLDEEWEKVERLQKDIAHYPHQLKAEQVRQTLSENMETCSKKGHS
ncbi:uncharacterized protein CFAP97D2-like [Rhincodon typus]|uniref:uncharacterized protein CFAP97D2-like n=1 Tax=Rhincodon typus TaxID=259920 RepID=UPI00202F9E89|nr:uncharacterized protein CFAP97D2-like [Rhincodon typus]